MFHGSAYPKEISQQCTHATHTEAVNCRGSFWGLPSSSPTNKGSWMQLAEWSPSLSAPWRQYQWCGLRPSVLGQDRSETKTSVLVLVLVLHVWCCVVKHGLVALVVIMILKDTATFQVLFIVSLFCAWNSTIAEINSGVHLLRS